ncbi:hypothetical protein CTEN210_05491 [Chaetoceros tenuissimus]|uniref:Uncharacterized protein n=1 Tax=Chaetoceros tenuissimus TaxID=426638 RepID=A0AAD3CPY5_9STRA|nr:hypothetical protein CTEN210_05491 [Chaetoceros tenuissimus]
MHKERNGLYSRNNIFDFYLFTIRDPFERAVSAFLYSHPENRIAEIPYKEWKSKNPEKFINMLKTQNESKIFVEFSKEYKRKANIHPRQYKSLFGENGVNLIAYNCFPTIENFATLLTQKNNLRNLSVTNKTYLENMVQNKKCDDLANMIMQRGLVWPEVMGHFYHDLNSITWNIGVGLIKHQNLLFSRNKTKLKQLKKCKNNQFVDDIVEDIGTSSSSHENVSTTIMIIRTEFLVRDWIQANVYLGQNATDIQVPQKKVRDSSNVFRPVINNLSSLGNENLCFSLEKEYSIYFSLLFSSVNLSHENLKDSIDIAKKNCGKWLNFDVAPKTLNEIHGQEWFN